MDSLIAQAKTQRDQAKNVYKTWDFAVDILENVNRNLDSPIGLQYPFEDKIILALPVAQGIIDLRTEEEKQLEGTTDRSGYPISYQYKIITINIQPDPVQVAKNMNITLLPNPIQIPMTLSGPANGDGELTNYDIYNDRGNLLLYGSDPEETNIHIPETILKELADQIGPRLSSRNLKFEGDQHELFGYFNFTWLVYLVVPPNK